MWSVKNWNGADSPYSSPMNSIGTNGDRSVHIAASGRTSARRRSPNAAVADLVMVLVEHDELRHRPVVGRRAEALAAERRVLAVMDVRPVERLRQLGDLAELLVPARAVARQQDPQGMVEVIGPHGIEAPSAEVVERITFGSFIPLSAITTAPGRVS